MNYDDDEDALHFLLLASSLKQPRKSYWVHQRVNWDEHVAKLLHENRFHTRYRIPLEDFQFLVRLLREHIEPNSDKRYCPKERD